jgi:hypothetical protein
MRLKLRVKTLGLPLSFQMDNEINIIFVDALTSHYHNVLRVLQTSALAFHIG